MSHTPEPWKFEYGAIVPVGIRNSKQLNAIAHIIEEKSKDGSANAARIVACVNGCAGLSNPAEAIRQWRLMEVEHKRWIEELAGLNPTAFREALEALKVATRNYEVVGRQETTPKWVSMAEAALAHAEGGQP